MLPNKIRDRRSNNTKKPIRSKMKRRKDHREEVWYSLPLPVFDHIGEDINSREQENASFVEWENQEKEVVVEGRPPQRTHYVYKAEEVFEVETDLETGEQVACWNGMHITSKP